MPVWVLGVGGFVRCPHGDQRESARRQIEEGVGGLAEDAQAACQDTYHQLGQHEHDPDDDRGECD